MSEVKLIKLVNGEQLIGMVTDEDAENIGVKKPIVIFAHPQGMAMRPWLMGSKGDSVTIKQIHVIATDEVEAELAQEYNEKYGSGLAVATPQQTAILTK